MASIKKDDKTGTYYFVLDLPRDPVTGARRQKKRRGYKTKKEAQQAAAELLHELTRGTHIEETDMSFKSFCDSFINEYETSGVKRGTVLIRKSGIKVLLRYFNIIPIKDISKKMYQSAITDMKKSDPSINKKPYSDSTIISVHACAKLIFKRALELELIKSDPTAAAKLPKTLRTVEDLENSVELPKFLEKEELSLFLKTAKDHGLYGDYEAFTTLAYTGMRIGELIVLREHSDLNFDENTISITKTYFNPTNSMLKYSLEPPKTKKSKRVIDCDPEIMHMLKTLIASNKEFKMMHRKTYYDKGYVFPNREKCPGYPFTINHFDYRMNRLLKIAGLNENLTPHSLRHTHTSLLAEAGVSLEEIMDRLGHKDDDTTKQVYLHVTKTRKKEASEKFSQLMNSL